MTPRQQISEIDKRITAIRRKMLQLEVIAPVTASDYQRAWDRHPDLRTSETTLFRQRGLLQLERDAYRPVAHKSGKLRRHKCPTCGRAL